MCIKIRTLIWVEGLGSDLDFGFGLGSRFWIWIGISNSGFKLGPCFGLSILILGLYLSFGLRFGLRLSF